jgi:hypothetical protein
LVEAEWTGGDHITGANDQDRFILMGIGDPHHLAMPRGYSALVAALQHGMRGDQSATLKNLHLVGQCVHLDDPLSGRVGNAVKIAADAHHALMRDAPFQFQQRAEGQERQRYDALIAGKIDVAIFASQLDTSFLQRALGAPGLRLMNVAQAEAIAKTVSGLKHLVLSRGIISLTRDIPNSDVDLLASRNSLLVRKDLHPALQYLLLEAMREVHWAPGPFNRLGEFPAEQPNDLPLSPTAEAFYRSGPSFWQRYTSFWLTSLLNRIVFFVIPVVAALIPVIGFAPRLYRWLFVHRINQLHRALGNLERELAHSADRSRLGEYEARLAEIESAVRMFKVARPFEIDLHRLRIHLRMVQENVSRIGAIN